MNESFLCRFLAILLILRNYIDLFSFIIFLRMHLLRTIFAYITTLFRRPIELPPSVLVSDPVSVSDTVLVSEPQYVAKEYWHIVLDNLGEKWIGLVIEVVNIRDDDIALCVDVLMKANVFLRFPIQEAKQYLVGLVEDYGDVVVFASDLEDVLRIYDLYDVQDYPTILKTHWIRIIQRKWRRIYAEKMRKWRERGSLRMQKHFELNGNYRLSVIKYKN